MIEKRIARLGDAPFLRTLRPGRAESSTKAEVVGWDTEYTSRGSELLSVQLVGRREVWKPLRRGARFGVRELIEAAREACGYEAPRIVLVAYWSIAELQHFDVLGEATGLRMFGSSLDVEFSDEAGTVETFDVARFFDKQPLSAAAKSIGERKLDWNRTNVVRADLRDPSFRRYAMHDAVLARKLYLALESALGVSLERYRSPGGCAAASFRDALPAEIAPPPSRVRRQALRSWKGGRAEALHRGKVRDVFEHDLASAYPRAAIAIGAMPGTEYHDDPERGERKGWHGCARVRFTFPAKTWAPCIPVDAGGALLFPLRGESDCTLEEIRAARKLGATIHYVDGWSFDPRSGTDTLAQYLRGVLAAREKAEGAERVALKLRANSLIGKLAQHVEPLDLEACLGLSRDLKVPLVDILRLTPQEHAGLGLVGEVSLGSIYRPEWAALVTGHVRATLGLAIQGTRAVYAATDAVWTRVVRPPSAEWSTKRSGEAHVLRTRLAKLGDHVVHHGVQSRTAAESLFRDGENAVRYTRAAPARLLSAVREGVPFGTWRNLERSANGTWDHKRRIVHGGETLPHFDAGAFLEARAAQA